MLSPRSIIATAAAIRSVTVTPSAPKVAKGLTQQFTATATFSDGTTQDVTTLSAWSIKDTTGTGVAGINSRGLATAKSIGKARITARYLTASTTANLEVTAAALIGTARGLTAGEEAQRQAAASATAAAAASGGGGRGGGFTQGDVGRERTRGECVSGPAAGESRTKPMLAVTWWEARARVKNQSKGGRRGWRAPTYLPAYTGYDRGMG